MKKTFLAAALIAVTALFLSCSNGSSDSGSSAKYTTELFADTEVTTDVTTGRVTLSPGNWIRSNVRLYPSINNTDSYVIEYTVSDTAITCTKYTYYTIYDCSEQEAAYLKQMSTADLKSMYHVDEIAWEGNKMIGTKNGTAADLQSYSRSYNYISYSSSYTIKTNGDSTKYLATSSSSRKDYYKKK